MPEPKQKKSVNIDYTLWRALKLRALELEVYLSELIERLLSEGLKKAGKP